MDDSLEALLGEFTANMTVWLDELRTMDCAYREIYLKANISFVYLEKATNPKNRYEDWEFIMGFCDKVNASPEG